MSEIKAKHPFYWIDSFTSAPLTGNPCAVFLECEGLSAIQMQNLARELNLSETAFVMKSSRADFAARYFTPAEEIPLAGHPTLAVARALIESGGIQIHSPLTKFSLELKAGVITIEIRSTEEGGYEIGMEQLKPQFVSEHDPNLIAPLFGLDPDDFSTRAPIQTVSTGTPQLMILVKTFDALNRAQVHNSKYLEYKSKSDFFSPHLFFIRPPREGNPGRPICTVARHFGVPPDTPEDPFTGSATGAMGAYLWKYGQIESPQFWAEQGEWLNRPGEARVEIEGPPTNIHSIRVYGKTALVFQGEIGLRL